MLTESLGYLNEHSMDDKLSSPSWGTISSGVLSNILPLDYEGSFQDDIQDVISALQYIQCKISDEMVKGGALSRELSISNDYKDDIIEQGMVDIKTSMDILRNKVGEERKLLQKILADSVRSIKDKKETTVDARGAVVHTSSMIRKTMSEEEVFQFIESTYPKDAEHYEQLHLIIVDMLENQRLLNNLSCDLDVLRQHMQEREEIISMYDNRTKVRRNSFLDKNTLEK